MMKKKKLKEVIYIKINKLYSIMFILLLLSLMIVTMGFVSLSFTQNIISVLSIIISFSIMMITYTVYNMSNDRNFYFFSMTFFIASIVKIINYISKIDIEIYDNKTLRFTEIFPETIISVMMLLNLYFIINCIKPNIKIKYWVTVFIVFILCSIVAYSIKDLILFKSLSLSLVIIFLLLAFVNNRRFPLKRGKEINYVYAYILYLIIANVIELINICIFNVIATNIFQEYINLVMFTMFFGCILQQMLNNSYNSLFSDIYNRNNNLSELNNKIMAKSMELEFSQKIIYKREDMFKNLFKNIPIPMLLLNLSNGRILYSNPTFLSIVKASGLKKVINKKISDFVDFKEKNIFKEEDYNIKFSKIYEAIIKNGEEKFNLEFQFLEISKDDDQCLVIITDITDKINSYEIKTKLDHKKIEEKLRSDFLSNISHDLKIPINVIYSAAQLEKLLINNENFDEVKRYQNISKDNCISLIRLTNNLIDNSKLSSDFLKPNLEYCNLVEIIEEMIMKLVEYAKIKDIDLIFDTNEEEIYIYLDKDFMERIILNLVSNALKYTPKKGKIVVVIKDREDVVTINVVDNGAGMEEEFVNNAFNRYSRGKNNDNTKEKGTGIGLFVVKNLVELQNGAIEIKSKMGTGTTIILKFNKEFRANEHIS